MPTRVPPRRTTSNTASAPSARRTRDEDEDEYPEEEEETPRRRSRAAESTEGEGEGGGEDEDRPALGAGWGAWDRAKQNSGGDFPDEFKATENESVLKFLEDGPFASYGQHWFNELDGKKSWVCIGEDCPLCALGDQPSARAVFNVVDMSAPKPKVAMLIVGVKLGKQIATFNKQKATTPINRDNLYWAIVKVPGEGTGKKAASSAQTNLRPIKERDLAEDFDLDPLAEDEITKLEAKVHKAKDVQVHTRAKLKEVAALVAA